MCATSNLEEGTVYWFTGLSGSGKTTIGKLFYSNLRQIKPNVVFLDGDILRGVFGNHGYSLDERKNLAFCYGRLCKMLSEQRIDVICATISMYRECQKWNRSNISKYKEIYLRVPIKVLVERDQKQLYSRALKGEVNNIMGIDLEIDEPESPDAVIDNDGSKQPTIIAKELFEMLCTKH